MNGAAWLIAGALALAPVSAAEEHTSAGEAALEAGEHGTAAAEFAAAYELLSEGQRSGEIAVMLVDQAVAASEEAFAATDDDAHLHDARKLLLLHVEDLDRLEDPGARREVVLQHLMEIDAKLGIEDPYVPPPPQRARAPAIVAENARAYEPRRELVVQRRAGIALIPAGGAHFVVGLGLLFGFSVRAQEFGANLARDNDAYTNMCPTAEQDTMSCLQLETDIQHWRAQGRRANIAAVALGTPFLFSGILLTAVGIGLLVSSNKKLERERELAVGPGGFSLKF